MGLRAENDYLHEQRLKSLPSTIDERIVELEEQNLALLERNEFLEIRHRQCTGEMQKLSFKIEVLEESRKPGVLQENLSLKDHISKQAEEIEILRKLADDPQTAKEMQR